MKPAQIVVKKFGGVRAAARKLGLNPSTVCRWGKNKQEGGTDGYIPREHYELIMKLLGSEISLEQLCFGDQK